MDIENTKRSQVKIQKTAGVEQCFPGWVSNLDGRSTHDGATARRPRYQARATAVLVWNGGRGPLPLLAELVMAHQGWQTDGRAQRAKIRLQETARARHDAFGASSLLQISKSQCRPERPGRSGCGGAIRQSKGPEFHADRNAHNRPEPGIKFYILRFRPVCTFLGEAARTAWVWLAMTIACQRLHFLEVLFPRSSSF
jgi:hypothetical protein